MLRIHQLSQLQSEVALAGCSARVICTMEDLKKPLHGPYVVCLYRIYEFYATGTFTGIKYTAHLDDAF